MPKKVKLTLKGLSMVERKELITSKTRLSSLPSSENGYFILNTFCGQTFYHWAPPCPSLHIIPVVGIPSVPQRVIRWRYAHQAALVVGRTFRMQAKWEVSSHWGLPLTGAVGLHLFLFLSFASQTWVESFSLTHAPAMMCLISGLKQQDEPIIDQNLSNHESEQIVSLYEWIISGVCYRNRKLTNTIILFNHHHTPRGWGLLAPISEMREKKS